MAHATAATRNGMQGSLPFPQDALQRSEVRAAAARVRERARHALVRARALAARVAIAQERSSRVWEAARAVTVASRESRLRDAANVARFAHRSPQSRAARGRVLRRDTTVHVAAATSAEHFAVDRRSFIDETGALWSVRELDCRRIPGAAAERCLIFDSAAIVRRIWRYPAGWAALQDDALRLLLESPR